MNAARQRRVEGLGATARATTVAPPPSPVHPAAETPPQNNPPSEKPAQRPRRPRRPGKAPAPVGKHRRAVTVPTPLVEQLRRRAQELDRFQTDLILDCLSATAATLEQEHQAEQAPSDSPFRRPRRRAYRGRTVTTLTLYLTRDEVEAMDALAQRLGLARSAVVALSLDRALGQLE
jgi:hypothetical protein